MNKLWKFEVGFGGMGDLEGLFIASEEDIENLIEKVVYFGEVLGKHSEVILEIERSHLTDMDISQETLSELGNIFGNTILGHNPLEYELYTEQSNN